jgi:hypothetical protein
MALRSFDTFLKIFTPPPPIGFYSVFTLIKLLKKSFSFPIYVGSLITKPHQPLFVDLSFLLFLTRSHIRLLLGHYPFTFMIKTFFGILSSLNLKMWPYHLTLLHINYPCNKFIFKYCLISSLSLSPLKTILRSWYCTVT